MSVLDATTEKRTHMKPLTKPIQFSYGRTNFIYFYLISTFSIEKVLFFLIKKRTCWCTTHTVMMRSEYYYIIYSVFPSLNWTQACLILNSIIIKNVWLSDVSVLCKSTKNGLLKKSYAVTNVIACFLQYRNIDTDCC